MSSISPNNPIFLESFEVGDCISFIPLLSSKNLVYIPIISTSEDSEIVNILSRREDRIDLLVRELKNYDDNHVMAVLNSYELIKEIAPNLKCFTPGIRQEAGDDDQKRTMNAKQAIDAGSDCLIIGRPITKGNPKENIKKIISSLN